ncbi:MAG: cobalamin B12-binding domain-containing protein [Bacillota bacterium]
MAKKVKVVMAKLGLDIHWRGAVVISRLLRDAGMEVVYIGNKFPEEIVDVALQEGADVVGLSTLSGNHLSLGPKVVNLLREKGAEEVLVLIGGVIPPEDFPKLQEKGVTGVFGPETPIEKIVSFINDRVTE